MTKLRARLIGGAAGVCELILILIFGHGASSLTSQLVQGQPDVRLTGANIGTLLAGPEWGAPVTSPSIAPGSTGMVTAGQWITVVTLVLLTGITVEGVASALGRNNAERLIFLGAWGLTAIVASIAFLLGSILETFALVSPQAVSLVGAFLFLKFVLGAAYGVTAGIIVAAVAQATSWLTSPLRVADDQPGPVPYGAPGYGPEPPYAGHPPQPYHAEQITPWQSAGPTVPSAPPWPSAAPTDPVHLTSGPSAGLSSSPPPWTPPWLQQPPAPPATQEGSTPEGR